MAGLLVAVLLLTAVMTGWALNHARAATLADGIQLEPITPVAESLRTDPDTGQTTVAVSPSGIRQYDGFRVQTLETDTWKAYLIHINKNASVKPYWPGADNKGNVKTVAQIHQLTGAPVVINAGFFDPATGLPVSWGVAGNHVVADPATNTRMVNNPALAPYLQGILTRRPEFRVYQCGRETRYAIEPHNQSAPAGCALVSALGGGPTLFSMASKRSLYDYAVEEAFIAYNASTGALSRDPLGVHQPNARSGVGITDEGTVIIAMVAQTKPGNGINLEGLARLLKAEGAAYAMALDGGSSSSLVIEDEAIYGKLGANGSPVIRPVHSALIVLP